PVPSPARCERLPPKERPAMLARPTRVPPICVEPAKRLPRCAPPMRAPPICTARKDPPRCPPNPPPCPPKPAKCPPPPCPPPPPSAPPATMPAASAAAGVCLEREKRHDEEQYRGHASASREH